jgi:dipeptidyl aminopeptidase/acylaminoacyl peptidase
MMVRQPASLWIGENGGMPTWVRWTVAAFAALLFGRAPAPAQSPFTLEQIMGAPFVSELIAAPQRDRIAWVVSIRGVRNIWVAQAPDYRARPITAYTADDGREISSLRWVSDGAAVLFIRGGSGAGEPALWIVSASMGEPRRLDEGRSPAVSPGGDRVAYLKQGQIWSAALLGDPKPAQLCAPRGDSSSLRWSPDGSALAFVSTREDHGFIGVYDTKTQFLRYLDPSVDRDSEPVWSPDGQRIAFLRIPNSRVLALFGPKRSAEPWSIRIADAATGEGRELWRAKPGRGSVFWPVTAENQLLWAAENRIVFPCEADGWAHLYSVSAAGGGATLLTPGEFEAEDVSLSPDGKQVVYSSNQGDLDRLHVWSVPARGGSPVAVTSGEGIEWSPLMLTGGAVAFLRSDAREPGRPFLWVNGKTRELVPAALTGLTLATPQPVAFSAADGLPIRGQLFLPAGLKPGERRPAVIFFHGGSRRQMLLGWHPMDYYHNTYAFNQYLAGLGFVVLSVNYRSGTGYGMEFREALNYGAAGASEFNDVLGAGAYLKNRPDVDPRRIGLWGGSYGGYLTALGLARASDTFAAGVDLHGVHDWRTENQFFLPSDDLATQEAALRLALASSPLADVKDWRSPVLLIHGDDDPDVQFRQTVQLVEALRKQSVEFEQLIFPDEVHTFRTYAHWLEAFRAAAGFLERKLKLQLGSN